MSDGGEDASTIREFDVTRRSFVDRGFTPPRGKQDVAWESNDALLVAREWTSGDLTASGYPYIVKRLERDQRLNSAAELYRGTKTDVGVAPTTLQDAQGNRAVLIVRHITFFANEYRLLTPNGLRKLHLPEKIDIEALIAGRLLFRLNEDWNVNGTSFASGSLVSCGLAELQADPDHPRPTLIYAPGARESLDAVAATRSRLIIVTYENVKGRAFVYTPENTGGVGETPTSSAR